MKLCRNFSVQVNNVQGDDKILSTLNTMPDFLGRVLVAAFFRGADVRVLFEGTSPREGSFGPLAELRTTAADARDGDDDAGRLTRVCEL